MSNKTDAIFAGTLTQNVAATMFKGVNATADWLSIVIDVTNVAGTDPVAKFRLQWSLDGGTWAEATGDEFPPITSPCTVVQRFDVKAPYWRAVCELEGTDPAFTGSANSYS